MNELIESGDPRAKVVGTRRPPAAGSDAYWENFNQMQKNFHRMWGALPFRKGVYPKNRDGFEQEETEAAEFQYFTEAKFCYPAHSEGERLVLYKLLILCFLCFLLFIHFPFQVYRFKTMEEFDEWKANLMMRNAPGRRE